MHQYSQALANTPLMGNQIVKNMMQFLQLCFDILCFFKKCKFEAKAQGHDWLQCKQETTRAPSVSNSRFNAQQAALHTLSAELCAHTRYNQAKLTNQAVTLSRTDINPSTPDPLPLLGWAPCKLAGMSQCHTGCWAG